MNRPRLTAGLLLTVLLFAAPVILFLLRLSIYDHLRLLNYHPPVNFVQLANQTTLTPLARHYLYVNHPALDSDVDTFRTHCPNAEQTIVLGCYQSGETGIYVYQVKDARLAGIEQVTAAHETLHAAYERLNSADRKYVNGLLQDYYKNNLRDPRIVQVMQDYQKTEPHDLVDEMHSVFGTEIANLPAPLENYYKRFFTSRAVVVAFSQAYESVFTNRINQVKADDAQLAQQKTAIDNLEKSLQDQSTQINSQRSRLDQLKSSNQIDEYNAAVGPFNSLVSNYNGGVDRLKSLITSYNQLVDARNAIASELSQLDQSIDTRLTQQKAQ